MEILRALKGALLWAMLLISLSACTMVGPDFVQPTADVSQQWVEADDERVRTEPPQYKNWWQVFNDPVLDNLIKTAYEQNLPLRIAGVRVFEARALLGIAIGEWYPQVQQGFGSAIYNRVSENAPSASQSVDGDYSFWQADIGIGASWELDFWGKFRRAIESADANFLSSIAAYDDVLVSLTADVAFTYVLIRTFEERLRIARENLVTQKESLRIAQARFEAGATSERDVQQALTQLNSTESEIPFLETGLRQAQNGLSILLGMPPGQLDDLLDGSSGIPRAPLEVAVGIPAELLRRRPDIRNAELQAAAQSGLIGVAKADLYPSFSLIGSFGFLSSDVGKFDLDDIFLWESRTASFGPSFRWNILNYGQITNTVRVQDARFQELIVNYQNTVLRAQQEVEDGLVAFLKGQERVDLLSKAVEAAKRSADLALIQYREGATDYTTVLTAQQALLSEQDRLAGSQGEVPQGLIAVYRALGGGWEIREGKDFIPLETMAEMKERTNWGGLLKPAAVQQPPDAKPTASIRTPDW
jgi:NodT family efflux transporter outer membrane factor (OMF) lipoprotein